MRKKELYAYLAGIIDGEAYVGIKKSTWGLRNRPDVKSPTYHEIIQIRMCNKEILQLFRDTFGGTFYREKRIYQSKSGFQSSKIMHCYRVSDKIASEIIRKILPYLIEKRRQAETILKLRKNKESKEARLRGGKGRKRPMSPKILKKRESLYQFIKSLH